MTETIQDIEQHLGAFDFIVVNTSAGKDSQAMMDYVCKLAKAAGVLDRVVAVHADLGRVEWKGTRELAEEQAKHYGIRFFVVRREKGDLLAQVRARGMWPDSQNRYCTSDQKRDQVAKFITAITARHLSASSSGTRVRILNCMGFRAQESSARAKRQPLSVNTRVSNGKREVVDWLPIHQWSVDTVWATIKASGVRHHPAYDKGMPRLSCVFCIFAPKDALVVAGRENPELLEEYVRVEKEIGHTFRHGFSIAEVKQAIADGYAPKKIQNWNM
jgi:3'-phosphoadenosine 5'-phosphosulfate sulfotransferase (PAPS reductase)/FAD synthetase